MTKKETKLNLSELKICLASANNLIVESLMTVTGEKMREVVAIQNECHRLYALIDEELNDEGNTEHISEDKS